MKRTIVVEENQNQNKKRKECIKKKRINFDVCALNAAWKDCISPWLSVVDMSRMCCVNNYFNNLFSENPKLVKWRKVANNNNKKWLNNNECFKMACAEGNIALVEVFAMKIFPDWDTGRYYVIELIEEGMVNAAQNNQKRCCEYIIKNTRWIVKTETLYDYVLRGASRGGHLDLCKWAVSNGSINYFDAAVAEAVRNGHISICEWISTTNVNVSYEDIQEYFNADVDWAPHYGYYDVCKWLIETFPGEAFVYNNHGYESHGYRALLNQAYDDENVSLYMWASTKGKMTNCSTCDFDLSKMQKQMIHEMMICPKCKCFLFEKSKNLNFRNVDK